MSKIQKITVSNLKAISSFEATFNGCTAIVTGANRSGKSSFIRSLMDRMRSIKPDTILKQGESNGQYIMELTTGEKFMWEFDKKKEKMIFITEKNIKTALTKDICNTYFPHLFDVDKFLEMQPAKQRKEVEKISGIELGDIEKDLEEAIEERKLCTRLKEQEIAKTNAVGVPNYKLAKEEDKSHEALQTELNNAGVHNEKMKSFKYRVDARQATLDTNKKSIEEKKKEIAKLEEENMELETSIDTGNNYLKEEKNQLKTEEYLQTLRSKIIVIKKSNEEIIENNKIITQYSAQQSAIDKYENAVNEVKKFEQSKIDAIKNCHTLPPGFGFTDEGITYNGFTFDRQSLSSSEIYIAALQLASIGLGQVRTLYFDASLLDRNSLDGIEKWAESQGLQLLIERPDFMGGEMRYEILQNVD